MQTWQLTRILTCWPNSPADCFRAQYPSQTEETPDNISSFLCNYTVTNDPKDVPGPFNKALKRVTKRRPRIERYGKKRRRALADTLSVAIQNVPEDPSIESEPVVVENVPGIEDSTIDFFRDDAPISYVEQRLDRIAYDSKEECLSIAARTTEHNKCTSTYLLIFSSESQLVLDADMQDIPRLTGRMPPGKSSYT